MKKGQETKASLNELVIYHQNFPKKQVAIHCHEQIHVFIPLKGDIWIELKDERIRVTPGKMLILATNTPHSFESSTEQGERLIAMLDCKIKNTALIATSSLLKELFFLILVDQESNCAKRAYQLIKELVKELVQQEIIPSIDQIQSRAKDERICLALELMENDLDLSIEAIAKKVGASSKTLTRLFSLELQINPKAVQNLIRIDKAKALLKHSGMNVTQVAFEVGFNSLSSFIKSYRSLTGELPSQAKA